MEKLPSCSLSRYVELLPVVNYFKKALLPYTDWEI